MKLRTALAVFLLAVRAESLPYAQQQSPEAQALVQRAVQTELQADRDDHSLWRFNVLEKQEDNSLYDEIDTAQGSLRRKIEQAGHALTPNQQQAQTAKIQAFVTDPRAQAKQKKDGEHDDQSAEKLLNLLPRAFLWSIAERSNNQIILHFIPSPAFNPPDVESKVLAAMEGDLIVEPHQYRIATIRGHLTHDVTIFGFIGRLRQGGTFNVERRQLAPNIWQITETHVHIDGRALLMKTIGEQTDEVKTNFRPVPPNTTLAEAAAMLNPR